ncbi:hypothetical protein NDU88_003513 [Pleurodeles waltl]|uniref:Uncharacterized protein n=1 Tax=Pleurodeles waltl TaxID=8319 RepID=A0AAV7V0T1_PLEWA|nr:hypothetical protein NDU88_003513 [Pleurodeles waltl]
MKIIGPQRAHVPSSSTQLLPGSAFSQRVGFSYAVESTDSLQCEWLDDFLCLDESAAAAEPVLRLTKDLGDFRGGDWSR